MEQSHCLQAVGWSVATMNTMNTGNTGEESWESMQTRPRRLREKRHTDKKPVFLKFPVFQVSALPRRSPQGEDGRPHRFARYCGYQIPVTAYFSNSVSAGAVKLLPATIPFAG